MKRHLFIAVALLASSLSLSAQQTWFPTKVGTKLTYASYDAKGKPTDTYTYTITDVAKDGGKTTISYSIDTFDAKGNSTGITVPGKIWTADGYYHVDVKASLNGVVNLDAVTIKGHAPIIPENPKNGETLDDCHASIESLFVDIDWTNLKLTTGQSVTTPAGTFDAVLLEYDTNSKVAIIKVQSHTKEWYVKGIGTVRSEMYTKGKLSSSRELTSID